MKLFVTGGAGFIGSNFVRHILGANPRDTVLNFDLLTYAGDRSSLSDIERDYPDRYAFIHGDIADATFIEKLFATHSPDVVVNFAAESHNSRAVLDPSKFVQTNIVGTQVLLEGARRAGIGRFHHISTCKVYGDLPLDARQSFREDSP